jgi:hypothetical protein
VQFALSPALTPSAFSSEMNRGSSPQVSEPASPVPFKAEPGGPRNPYLKPPQAAAGMVRVVRVSAAFFTAPSSEALQLLSRSSVNTTRKWRSMLLSSLVM